MSDGMAAIMYENALIDLTAGRISDLDRQVLAYSPLPSSIVDPYMAKEVDAVESMNVAFSAMTLWIEEAKKASYFSKHFLELSRMIMNGVTTMGRGLVSLHLRGEDLGQSPMSIHDLIMVASYHIRKSYLGMLQTVKRWPEISGRLLVNQLGWTNTLLRLYKTKEKLEQKIEKRGAEVEVSDSKLEIRNEKSQAELEMRNEKLEMSGSTTGGALAAPEGRGLDPISAFSEPKSLGAVRAFRPVGSSQKTVVSRQYAVGSEVPGKDDSVREEETKAEAINEKVVSRQYAADSKNFRKDESVSEGAAKAEAINKTVNGTEETKLIAETEVTEEDKPKEKKDRKENTEKETAESLKISENGSIETPKDPAKPDNSLDSGEPGNGTDKTPEIPAELDASLESGEPGNKTIEPSEDPAELDDSLKSGEPENGADKPPEDSAELDDSVDSGGAEIGSAGKDPPGMGLPGYLQILRKVYERSGPSDDGALTFTIDEMEYLVSDPIFTRIYPDMAEALCGVLRQFPLNTPSQ